jgi:hypothetical protein
MPAPSWLAKQTSMNLQWVPALKTQRLALLVTRLIHREFLVVQAVAAQQQLLLVLHLSALAVTLVAVFANLQQCVVLSA